MIFSTIEFLFYFFPLLVAVYFLTSLKWKWVTAVGYVVLAVIAYIALAPHVPLLNFGPILLAVLASLLAGLFIFPHLRFKNLILLTFSLFFYLWGGGWQLTLVMMASIVGNFMFGQFIDHEKTSLKLERKHALWLVFAGLVTLAAIMWTPMSVIGAAQAWGLIAVFVISILIVRFIGNMIFERGSKANRKFIAWMGFLFNIGILGYFKYMNFFVEQINPLLQSMTFAGFELAYIALPIGISFYTFQSISYLLDIYDREAEPQKNLTDFGLYVALFPQLIAGPIVRYQLVADQITKRTHSFDDFTMGAARFCWGLAKKVLIADQMGVIVEAVYGMEPGNLTTSTAWLGALAYTMQIYFDFSGYSDMAIGLGRMFGFRFPENFTRPYSALSITDFWRRWHMTLSYWFRDYLYIRIGGSRGGWIATYGNLALVFFVTGLWHGAAWAFLIWGAYHGILLVIERLTGQRPVKEGPRNGLRRPFIFLLALIGWVVFRAGSLDLVPPDMREVTGLQFATAMYENMFGMSMTHIMIATVVGVAVFFGANKIGDKFFAGEAKSKTWTMISWAALYGLLAFAIWRLWPALTADVAVEAAAKLTEANIAILIGTLFVCVLPRDYFFGQMLETRGGLISGLIGLVSFTLVGLLILPAYMFGLDGEVAMAARWTFRALVLALAGTAIAALFIKRAGDSAGAGGIGVLWAANRMLVVGVLALYAIMAVVSGTFTAFLYYQF